MEHKAFCSCNLHKYMNNIADCSVFKTPEQSFQHTHYCTLYDVLLYFTCGSCTLVLSALTFFGSTAAVEGERLLKRPKRCAFVGIHFLQLQLTTIANVVTMATMSNMTATACTYLDAPSVSDKLNHPKSKYIP